MTLRRVTRSSLCSVKRRSLVLSKVHKKSPNLCLCRIGAILFYRSEALTSVCFRWIQSACDALLHGGLPIPFCRWQIACACGNRELSCVFYYAAGMCVSLFNLFFHVTQLPVESQVYFSYHRSPHPLAFCERTAKVVEILYLLPAGKPFFW